MPSVTLDVEIQADADRVWAAVVDVERYPAVMDHVRWSRIDSVESEAKRHTAWSIVLKGSILEWEENEYLDHEARVMRFEQTAGDMDVFTGSWTVTERGPGLTHVVLVIEFEIGIPLLADMLNPVAIRALRSNCNDMLMGVEREALAAAGAIG